MKVCRVVRRSPRIGGALPVLALLLTGTLSSCSPAKPPQLRNAVVIVVDTLRLDHLNGYGYPRETAPFLERLGAEGAQLEGYAASSWTKPSVATMLSGRTPQAHQAIERADSLPASVPYLPEVLADSGFATGAYVANVNVGRKLGFARGYQHFGQVRGSRKLDALQVNNRVSGLLEHLEEPYFLYVHYVDPHDPYEPERAWGETEVSRERLQPRPLLRDRSSLTTAETLTLVDQYDGEILEVDRAIEALVQELEDRNLLEETLVVITSDHGEEFGEHGRYMHGRSLYQEVIRVPLIFWSATGNFTSSLQRMHHIDAARTILDALGVPQEGFGGTSRWTELNGGPARKPEPLYFHLDLDGVGALAAIDEERKLIHENRGPELMLFDLGEDPGESAPELSSISERPPLLAELFRHHNAEAERAAESSRGEIDRETLDAIAALGYLEGSDQAALPEGRSVPPKLDRNGLPRP
ncbi:MAG: sulfatase [Acidobacteriota bacterium]